MGNKADRNAAQQIIASREVEGGDKTAYSKAAFVATKPSGSPNLTGYGFHNTGLNGAFLFFDAVRKLNLLYDNGKEDTLATYRDLGRAVVTYTFESDNYSIPPDNNIIVTGNYTIPEGYHTDMINFLSLGDGNACCYLIGYDDSSKKFQLHLKNVSSKAINNAKCNVRIMFVRDIE